MQTIRVLVTGAGSGVGQGIVKALNASSLSLDIISADISPFNCALYRTDKAVLIPKVEEEGALERVIGVINSNHIDVVMIGSEFDLVFFSEHKKTIEFVTSALVVASPIETVRIADDKWLTAEFLRKNNLPYADTYKPDAFLDAIKIAGKWGYPVLLKTRFGTSNRHVHMVNNASEMEYFFPTVPRPMLQKLIHMPIGQLDNEYTCSIFRTREGILIGPFTARRTLRGGSSWIVEVDHFKELHPLLMNIGEKLSLMGTLNVQLMIGKNGPIPFEFNARFSGTTAIRAHFGFNEPEMTIRSYFLKEELSQITIRKGMVFRYLEEVFIEDKNAKDLGPPFTKGNTISWF